MALAVVRNYKMLLNDVGKIVRNKRAQKSKEKYKIGVSLHISFDAEIVLLVREIGSQQASLNLTEFTACLLERNEMNKWQQAYCLFAWYTDFEEKRFSTQAHHSYPITIVLNANCVFHENVRFVKHKMHISNSLNGYKYCMENEMKKNKSECIKLTILYASKKLMNITMNITNEQQKQNENGENRVVPCISL